MFAGENPADECVYLTGNSLGLLPRGSRDLVQQEMDKWSKKALYGHMEGEYPWYPIEDFVAQEFSDVVGCKKDEVTAMNSLTANIHFALVCRFSRHVIFLMANFLYGWGLLEHIYVYHAFVLLCICIGVFLSAN